MTVAHKFVEFIPEELEEKTLYISLEHRSAMHKCMCGCGEEIVTPISPDDWELTFNGESISLYPSIGNWSYRCRSHYWIKRGRVIWAEDWSDEKVYASRNAQKAMPVIDVEPEFERSIAAKKNSESWFTRLFNWIGF